MSWGKIKKAINSTVGTSEFQPLDKLIRYEGKRFAPDTSAFVSKSFSTVTSKPAYNTIIGPLVDLCSFRANIGGSFTASAPVTTMIDSTTIYASLKVYINDVYYGQGTFTRSPSGSASGTASVNVSFNPGDKISFKFQTTLSMSVESSNNYATCSRVDILAKVVDNVIEDL